MPIGTYNGRHTSVPFARHTNKLKIMNVKLPMVGLNDSVGLDKQSWLEITTGLASEINHPFRRCCGAYVTFRAKKGSVETICSVFVDQKWQKFSL